MIFRIFRNFLRKKIGLIVAEFLELPCLKSSFPDHMTTGRRPYEYDDDTDDENDHKNDSYTAAGAAPGTSVPCSLFIDHLENSLKMVSS